MANQNKLGFGKDNESTAQPIGISGVGNDELRILSLKSKTSLVNIFKELKKFNMQLALMNGAEISQEEVDAHKSRL
jgi:hypothetical protein